MADICLQFFDPLLLFFCLLEKFPQLIIRTRCCLWLMMTFNLLFWVLVKDVFSMWFVFYLFRIKLTSFLSLSLALSHFITIKLDILERIRKYLRLR